ncbi:MAG: hypothetical protein WDM71_06135 [Ferruginibacter sp.]
MQQGLILVQTILGASATDSFYTLSNPPTAQGAFGTTTGITCNQDTLHWTAATFALGIGASDSGYIIVRQASGSATAGGVKNGVAPTSLTLTAER